jgi:DNA-binding protein HU-beta
MTKSELVSAMSEKTGVSKKDTAASIDAFVEIISDVLKHGDKLQLVGFGTFEVSERAARTGRNPQTGEDIKIPAAKIPKFKAGAALKNAVNSGK